jgi:hypothetical protein
MGRQRPANSTVRHGNPACVNYGCKEAECIEASRVYKRENDRARREGVRATVDTAEAVKHIHELMKFDMPIPDMEKISGVHSKTFVKILNGRCERIHWVTEEAILGIPVPETGWESSADCYVNAIPATRRLQALGVQGFTVPVLSTEMNVEQSVINSVRSGRRLRIRMKTMRSIRRAHDRLYDADPLDYGVSRGDLTRALRFAEKQGWYPTEAWADIDDPECEPILKTPRYISLTEDARELIEQQDYTLEQAAGRLGVTVNAIQKARARYRENMAKAS